jgi:hypothetical protein
MNVPLRVFKSFFALVAGLAIAAAQPGLAANWKQLSPPNSPPGRSLFAMVYDPISKKVIAFGGSGATGNLNDTWAFDGTTWTKINTTGAPSARNGVTLAYDRPTKKLVMFGGYSGSKYLSDTWTFDGATSTWTQVNMPTPPPKATGTMLFSDPVTGRAMMFGGYDATQPVPVYANTYLWAGTHWKKLHPATIPLPRAWGIATLDVARHNVVLTGGVGDTIRTDNTWTWDGADWTQVFPATQIQGLFDAAYAYDPAAQAVVVFGGVAESWEWDGTTWIQVVPGSSPTQRDGPSMATLPASRQTIMFGGSDTSGELNETWQLIGK